VSRQDFVVTTTFAELDRPTVVVTPGAETTTTLAVRNDSDIVEAYEFEVLGECAPWTTVEPTRLTLYPATTASVTVSVPPAAFARRHRWRGTAWHSGDAGRTSGNRHGVRKVLSLSSRSCGPRRSWFRAAAVPGVARDTRCR